MARKPRSEWSESYRRRVESAERRGLTRQQARGHGGEAERGESRTRRQRRASRLIELTELPDKRQQSEGEVYAELLDVMDGSESDMLRYLEKLWQLMQAYREYSPEVDDLRDELYEICEEHEMDGSWRYYH